MGPIQESLLEELRNAASKLEEQTTSEILPIISEVAETIKVTHGNLENLEGERPIYGFKNIFIKCVDGRNLEATWHHGGWIKAVEGEMVSQLMDPFAASYYMVQLFEDNT